MNIRLNLEKWVGDAVEKYKLGQETDYAVFLSWTPAGDGLKLAWNIPLITANPLLGQEPLVHLLLVPIPSPTETHIDQSIMQGMGVLREMRANVLRVSNGGRP